MGCDIHMHYEIKSDEGWNSLNWRAEFAIGNYDDGSTKYNWDKLFESPFYVGRNYDLFAILADVRNGRGFAGVKTGDGFNPIDLPRGLPDDVSDDVRVESEGWGLDGHSRSWFLLTELLAADWDQRTNLQGIVSESEYKTFKANGHPDGWAGGVWGQNILNVSNDEMDKIISGEIERQPEKEYMTTVVWEVTYRETVGEAWFTTLHRLEELYGAENVRVVFWFDN